MRLYVWHNSILLFLFWYSSSKQNIISSKTISGNIILIEAKEESMLFVYFQGKTNDKGIHEIKISYHGIEQVPRTTMVHALAAISDLNNQIQKTQTTFLIHPCRYYVGFKLVTNFGKKDTPVQTKVIVTDIDGNLIDNLLIECQIVGNGNEKKENENGLIVFVPVIDEQRLTAVSSSKDAVNIDFTPKLGN